MKRRRRTLGAEQDMSFVDKTGRIGTEKTEKLLFEFSVPAIIGMIVNAMY
jgi:Na+-driven multidrug efflux pump